MKTVETVKPIRGTFAGSCRFEAFSFGSIRIDGVTYEHDVLIDRGQVRKRKKKPSKKFREAFGHTPLSVEEEIPWKCRRLVIGTGTGALPVMDEVKKEAKRRHVQLLMMSTAKAIEELREPGGNKRHPTRDLLKFPYNARMYMPRIAPINKTFML
jgi:hypothetical protein